MKNLTHNPTAKPKYIFCGSNYFAASILRDLVVNCTMEPIVVVTQPDRPAGRGMKLAQTPVKKVALELGLPVKQCESVNNDSFIQFLKESGAEVALVIAFGQILSNKVLNALPKGFFNIHLSLLPQFRGAAPVPWALANGALVSGVTCFRIVRALDAGPILGTVEVPISQSDTSSSLFEKLYEPALELSRKALNCLCGDVELVEQDHDMATYAPIIKTSDGSLNFILPVWKIDRLIRAFGEKPGTYAYWHHNYSPSTGCGKRVIRLRILDVSVPVEPDTGHSAGCIVKADPKIGLFVQCGMGIARINFLRPEGKKTMSGTDFVMGYRPKVGDMLLHYGAPE